MVLALRLLAIFAASLYAVAAFAQTADQNSQCTATTEAAREQAVLLRTPNAIAGVTQSPIPAAPAQFIAGSTSSVANIRKASKILGAAATACKLYTANEDVALKIQYLPASLEKAALEHRLQLDKDATAALDGLIAESQARMSAKNLTRTVVYSLQSGRARLAMDRSSTSTAVAGLYVPELREEGLYILVAEKQAREWDNQHALVAVNKTADWDISTEVGLHHSLLANGATSAYGGFTFSYNIGRRQADAHADVSAQAYMTWKQSQVGEVVRNAEVLRKALVAGIASQKLRVVSLKAEDAVIQENLSSVKDVDTSAALAFRVSLQSDALLLRVELQDAQFREEGLRTALGAEFGEEVD